MTDYKTMRRGEREIKDFSEILDILRRADVIRLGLNGDPYPYAVPLSYGFEAVDGAEGCVVLYVHGAAMGLKHDLIARDNHVCVEADIFHGNAEYGAPGSSSVTTEYESVIGFGTAEAVGGAEAEKGMDLLLAHCGFPDFIYDKYALDKLRMYKITLAAVKGKRNLK